MADFEKTESPTQRRRDEAREQGNVVRSQDLTAGLLLLAAVLLLGVFGIHILEASALLLRDGLERAGRDTASGTGDMASTLAYQMELGGRALLPVALGLLVLSAVAGLLQVGFLVTGKPLVPQMSKLSPLRGVQQMFSVRSLMRAVMSFAKVGVVAGGVFLCVLWDLPKLVALLHLEPGSLLAAFSVLVWSLALKVAIVLLVLGILDYAYQRWQHEQDLLMTKEEVREEIKRFEGDPLIKQRRARVARQLIMQRLNIDVPKADVVVTNPTHFAVALKYESKTMQAPKVVAKGADFLALRIRTLAQAHGVPMVERPPLARALYRAVEVGQEIPAEHYAAVAEILAYVYRLSGRKTA